MRARLALATITVLLSGLLAEAPTATAEPATVAGRGFTTPADAVRDAAGGILVADTGDHRIKRIGPDGTVSTVAGTGAAGFSGDGGPATAAQLNHPRGVAALPDGGYLIADGDNWRVRRVGPDGTIRTVAGTGIMTWKCPATNLWLGEVRAVTPSRDGGFVVLSESGVFSVAPDGLTRFLSRSGASQDVDATVGGRLLLAGGEAHKIYTVSLGGAVEVLAGTGEPGSQDGQAHQATFHDVRAIAGTANGRALVVERPYGTMRLVWDRWVSSYRRDQSGLYDPPLRAPLGVSADPQGGYLIADGVDRVVWHVPDPGATPAPMPTAMPAGDNEACRGLDRSYGEGGVAFSHRHWTSAYEYLPMPPALHVDSAGRAAATTAFYRDGTTGIAVRRLTADGRSDPGFGSEGTAFTPTGATVYPQGLVQLSDGRYVAAAQVSEGQDDRVVLAAFTSSGRPDPGFGDGGQLTLPRQSGATHAATLVAGPDDVITVLAANQNEVWRVARVTATGRLVSAFGSAGVRGYDQDYEYAYGAPTDAVRFPDGRIVFAAGFRIARLTADGALDPTWDGDGVVELPWNGTTRVWSIALQPDGKLVAVGGHPAYARRFLADGRPDPTFGDGNGVAEFSDPVNLRDVVVRPDGRLVAVGRGLAPYGNGAAVVSLRADGSLDPSFDGRPSFVTPIGRSVGLYERIELMPGGKAIVTGRYDWNVFGNHLFARYDVGEPTVPAEFDGGDVPEGAPPDGAPPAGPSPGPAEPPAQAAREPLREGAPQLAVPPPLAPRPPRRLGLAVGSRVSAAKLRRRGLLITLRPAMSGRAVVRLLARRRVVARTVVRLRSGARRRVRLRARRLPRSVRVVHLAVDVGGRRVATRSVRLR